MPRICPLCSGQIRQRSDWYSRGGQRHHLSCAVRAGLVIPVPANDNGGD
jgi:hypothetical protein